MASSEEQLKALQRLADYKDRVQRLKRLWIDPNAKEPAVRYAGAGSRRRTPSPIVTGSARSDAAASVGTQGRDRSPSKSPSSRSVAAVPARERSVGRARVPTSKAKAKAGTSSSRHAVQQGPLTAAQIRELMTRELSPEDYELLLLLDEGVVKKSKLLSDDAASALPRASGTSWVDEACSICLCALEEDEDIRMLPSCGHCFHAPCAHRWLTVEKAVCPLCGREESKQDKIVDTFKQFDSDGDGLVQLSDMKAVLRNLDAEFWDDERIARLFQAADLDQDGKLRAADFVSWLCCDGSSVPAPLELNRGVTRNRVQEMVG